MSSSTGRKTFLKRRIYTILKISLIIIVFSLYFLILLRETMSSMEDGRSRANSKLENAPLNRQQIRISSESKNGVGGGGIIRNIMVNGSNKKYHISSSLLLKISKDITTTSLTTTKQQFATSTIEKNLNNNNKTTIQKKNALSSTLNPIYEYSEELNTAAELEFNERKIKLWDECVKYNIVGKYPPNAWEFFISPGHGITWCNVFKAASSTWMYYFNILGEYNMN